MPIFFPIGTDNIRKRFPKVTLALIIANVAIYFVTIFIEAVQERSAGNAAVALEQIEEPYIFKQLVEQGEKDPSRAWLLMPHGQQLKMQYELRKQMRQGAIVPLGSVEYNAWKKADEDFSDQSDRLLFNRLGFRPSNLNPFSPFTYMFLHGGFWHLFWNMYFLWLVGIHLEDVWSRKMFLGFYVLGGLVAAGLHYLVFHTGFQADQPLVGASGAIAAAMGAFMVRFYRNRIRMIVFWFVIWVPSWIALLAWFGMQVYYGLRYMDEAIGVAFWAHIGGFVFGMAVAGAVQKLEVEKNVISDILDRQDVQDQAKALEKKIKATGPERPLDLELGIQARKVGWLAEAREHLERAASEYPSNMEVHLELQLLYQRMSLVKEANTHQAVLVNMFLEQGEIEEALPRYRLLFQADPEIGLPGRGQYQIARLLEEHREWAIAAEAYRRFAADHPADELAPRALFQCANIVLQRLKLTDNALKILQFIKEKYPGSSVIPFVDQLMQQAKEKSGGG